jgi:hypothetical protein
MRRDRGQALLEFTALSLALAVVLLTPMGNGRSIAGVLLAAILGFLRAQAFVLSIV